MTRPRSVDQEGHTSMSSRCRVCRAETVPFAEGQVLGHVEVTYERCPACGLVMALEPTWLEEAATGTRRLLTDLGTRVP